MVNTVYFRCLRFMACRHSNQKSNVTYPITDNTKFKTSIAHKTEDMMVMSVCVRQAPEFI